MATITYMNQGAVRNQPLDPRLVQIYQAAAAAAGIDEIRVISGGQPVTGTNRVGSHRHDLGGAGDIQLVKNGRVLSQSNAADIPFFEKFANTAVRSGAVGVGAGPGYMNPETIHVGFGSPGVWGEKGGAPAEWLVRAAGAASPPGPGAGPGSEMFVPPTMAPSMGNLMGGIMAGSPFGVTPGGMTIYGGQPAKMNPFFTPEMRSM